MDPYGNRTCATEILPGLWLGNIESSVDIDFLQNENITCIINCTNTFPFPDIAVRKIRVPVLDNGAPSEIYKMYTLLDRGAIVINALLPRCNILVHCQAGKQRSVAILLAYLMKYCRFTLPEAVAVLKSKRKLADNINFSRALAQYQVDLWGI